MKTFSIPCIRPIWGKHNFQLQENLDSLKDAVEQLKNKKEQIKIKVKREESPYKERTYKVTDWLYRADRFEAQAEKVIAEGEEEIRGSTCCCSGNCFKSSEVGKRVREKLNSVNQIIIEGNFDVVVEKTPYDFVDVIDVETTVGFESKLDDVWSCLEDESIGIIGIYGMPGVGKTTLLKKIKDKFVEIQDFAHVIWVAVCKEASIDDAIQNVIRKQLSISNETWKNINKRDRAEEISRLLSSRKFILLLDDLWSRLDLLHIGVPLPNGNGSKVVFTSRSKGVCDDMKAQLKLKLKCLSREEALKLFSRNSVDYLAQAVNADFCQGLPLALVAVGQAMAGRNRGVWEHAITTLQNYPSSLPGMGHIFRIIEPSFDSLEDDIVKDCFMYSCMLPSVIRKDELIKLWIGEGFLDTSDNNLLGDYIIKRLKLSCLLEGDEKSDFVWMHSVIRAFGLWLASERGKNENKILVQEQRSEKWTKATRISIYGQIDVAPPMSPCPQVQTLLITDTNLSTFPIGLQSMNVLRVLNLSKNSRLAEIPSSIGSLINLQYLNLSFTSINELPIEVKNLANLKLFLVDYTENLQVIPKGVISSFSSLQVFSKLGNENFDDTTLLEELEFIEHMNDVSISLFSGLAIERMLNSIKLQSCIRKLSLKNIIEEFNFPVSVLSRMVHLEELVIEDCKYLRFGSENIQYYVLNIRSLQIQNCFPIYYLRWLLFAPRLQNLDLRNCASLHEIVGSDFESEEIKEIDERLGIFSNLKKLYLEDLPGLHYICPQALHFPALEDVVVIDCPNLLKLPFHSHSAKRLSDIKGSKSWWDHLHWEDEAVREVFYLKFQDVIEAEQTHDTRTAPPHMDWQQELKPLSIEASAGVSCEASPPHQFVHHIVDTASNTKGKSAVEPPIEVKRKSDRHAETAPSNTKGKGKGKSLLKSPIGIKRKSSETATSKTKEEKLVLESLIDIEKLGSSWPKPFTYKELVKATAAFSNENVLGMGGFGKVYKGLLPNGEVVAIKKFNNDSRHADKQFLAEIETISRIHHRNIIKLVGYCQNKTNRLLVYEFLPNNSLRFHLHDSKLIIDWSIRMRIALGTAKGLAYLHEDCEPRIIHRDFKPDNILLDLNFEPKIAGFGIALVLPYSESDEIHCETIVGTIGYLDPEYAENGKLTVKSDVYSFGVMLLELITGKRPYDYKAYGEGYKQNLVLWVKSMLRESIKSGNYYAFIDPKLEQNYDKDEMERMICCAAACVYKPADLRPQMSQIVEALKGNIPLAGIWLKDDDTFIRDGYPYAEVAELPFRTSSSCEDDLDDLEKHGR